MLGIACVTSVSVQFKSKKRGTRVKDRAKNGASERAGEEVERKGRKPPPPAPSFIFLAVVSFLARPLWLMFVQNRETRSSVFLCSETKRRRLLRRLCWVS